MSSQPTASMLLSRQGPHPELSISRKSTYGQILKSTALVGGSSILNVGISIVRTKAMAVWLGSSGVGLMGMYSSISDLALSIAGMGINSSGVRQIAEAVGSGETERIARTATVLRRISILLGLLGAVPLVVFSRQVSIWTFGSDQHAPAVVLLSLAVFFSTISAGQGALIQGMRRISDLAKMSVLGALFGTLIAVPLVYFLRERGVVLVIVCGAATGIITSWWYSRKVRIHTPSMTMSQVGREVAAILKLGFAFMASGLLTTGAAYAIRLIVLRKVGFEGAGLYQSAWALGGFYVGFILQAMAADFYPRLTVVSRDNAECNRLVNEQAQIGLLLAGPGVIATLTLAPLVIALFYSPAFKAAVDILRWICLGMSLRIIAWPMGFIVLAKGEQTIFFWTELAATLVHVALAWVLVAHIGLAGAGLAFFGLYVWHGSLIYFIVRRLSGFRWSVANWKIARLFLPAIALTFCGFHFLPAWLATIVGVLAALLSGVFSTRLLLRLISLDRLPTPVRLLVKALRLAPAHANE